MNPEIARITRKLQRYRQSATYEAVATILADNARSFMDGEDRNHQNSWVVSATNGLPTRYEQHQLDPALLETRDAGGRAINDSRELQSWLDRHEEIED